MDFTKQPGDFRRMDLTLVRSGRASRETSIWLTRTTVLNVRNRFPIKAGGWLSAVAAAAHGTLGSIDPLLRPFRPRSKNYGGSRKGDVSGSREQRESLNRS